MTAFYWQALEMSRDCGPPQGHRTICTWGFVGWTLGIVLLQTQAGLPSQRTPKPTKASPSWTQDQAPVPTGSCFRRDQSPPPPRGCHRVYVKAASLVAALWLVTTHPLLLLS